ncbi:MAG: alpha/beta fold hydrolase [Acidobacteriota bacterium]
MTTSANSANPATPERLRLQDSPELPGVVATDLSFESAGVRLAATLYTPAPGGEHGEGPWPGVLVTGAWTTVKEQMPGTYARELAARGLAALTFDFRGWGASEGTPRYVEDPITKTEDLHAAADFLATLPQVDASRLSGLGICASSGYMAAAVADHPALGRLALVAPWLHDPAMAEAVYGGPESVAALIAASRQAEKEEAILTAASLTDETAPMYQAPYYTEEGRGLIPAYDNRFNVRTWEPWLTYDAQAFADRLSAPTLILCSEAAALPAGAHAYVERLTAGPGAPVTEIWLDEVSQFDFYDRRDVVHRCADALAEHFTA